MIDKSIPYIGVLMVCPKPATYEVKLPDGYTIVGYKPGMEADWAELQFASGHTETIEKAEAIFAGEFIIRPDLLPSRCLFVLDPNGKAAATAALWEGNHLGALMPRVHWVCTRPEERRKGLAMALMANLMTLAAEMGDPAYLTTQTQSWPAIGMYLKFGFEPYMGEKPGGWKAQSGDFNEENQRAWQLIFEKLRLT